MKSTFLCAAVVILSCGFALGQATEKLLYSFGAYPGDGEYGGESPLVFDSVGDLYGIATGGGSQNGGAVFELSPNADGTWSENLLYSFCPDTGGQCPGGSSPSGLAIDNEGDLFGMTTHGGTPGQGTVFELSPPSAPGEAWTYSVVYNFCSLTNCLDGAQPYGSPALDGLGNLYGTTATNDLGVGDVWELSAAVGGWEETILHAFCSLPNCADGEVPETGVTLDKTGNLYGTTLYGGTKRGGGGTLYELSPGSSGWTERVLVSFPRLQLFKPTLGPASLDPAGNAYTTITVPNVIDGSVVRVKRVGAINVFNFDGTDGSTPLTGVVVDHKRALIYGTVEYIGSNYCGGIFQIDTLGQESAVYDFCHYPGDAATPGGLVEDESGNLYGSSMDGGAYGYGAVFEVTP